MNLINFNNQFTVFGFKPQGQVGGGAVQVGAFFDSSTFDFATFDGAIGTSAGPPPIFGAEAYHISSMDLTEQFVTEGRISAHGISYPFNHLSRRTN